MRVNNLRFRQYDIVRPLTDWHLLNLLLNSACLRLNICKAWTGKVQTCKIMNRFELGLIRDLFFFVSAAKLKTAYKWFQFYWKILQVFDFFVILKGGYNLDFRLSNNEKVPLPSKLFLHHPTGTLGLTINSATHQTNTNHTLRIWKECKRRGVLNWQMHTWESNKNSHSCSVFPNLF